MWTELEASRREIGFNFILVWIDLKRFAFALFSVTSSCQCKPTSERLQWNQEAGKETVLEGGEREVEGDSPDREMKLKALDSWHRFGKWRGGVGGGGEGGANTQRNWDLFKGIGFLTSWHLYSTDRGGLERGDKIYTGRIEKKQFILMKWDLMLVSVNLQSEKKIKTLQGGSITNLSTFFLYISIL